MVLTKTIAFILVFYLTGIALSFANSYDVCFTPTEKCANRIITEVSKAKKQILVQAYSFTDLSIAIALVKAKQRGADVQIIMDHGQTKDRHSLISFFVTHGIKPLIDAPFLGAAHNKIMIIDNVTILSGSYNFTNSANTCNVEKLLIIKDPILAKKYLDNWYERKNHIQKIISSNAGHFYKIAY